MKNKGQVLLQTHPLVINQMLLPSQIEIVDGGYSVPNGQAHNFYI